ncbi:unnamed protein product, partial [Ectocarpus sp. 4 AP-2014]
NPESDYLLLKKGGFTFKLAAKENPEASGDYIYQNNLLVFYFDRPTDTIRRFKIESLTDSTLVFNEKGVRFKFRAPKQLEASTTLTTNASNTTVVPSQGFSINSLWRGILGMFVLLVIAFLLSNNRKAINWKTVGLGLGFQLIIAVGVLQVPFVQSIFEFVGSIFIDVLEFTRAGSTFLFEGLMDVGTFGFIFAFQVLPTILFFSALTSVLFYLGIIQKLV